MSASSWVLQSTMPKMASSILGVKALKRFGGRILAVVDDLDRILIARPCRRFAGVICIFASRRRAGTRPSAKSISLQRLKVAGTHDRENYGKGHD